MTTRKSAVPVAKEAPKKTQAAVPEKKAKQKIKVIRDSFTMPAAEYNQIAEIKAACLDAGLPVKKSEVLRAGLQVLAGMSVAQIKRRLTTLEKIKTGRPKKHQG